MKKCDICGKRFELRKENRYEAIDIPVGLDCLTQPSTYYNAFNCPYCGCQNLVGKIKGCKSRPKATDNLNNVLDKISDDIMVLENNRPISARDVIRIIDEYKKGK